MYAITSDTGNHDTKHAVIYCTLAINAATFAMDSLRSRGIRFPGVISFVYISAGAPFLPVIDADLQRFYKEYFDDSDSEDDGILSQRRVFVGRQLIRYICAACARSRSTIVGVLRHKQIPKSCTS